MGEEERVTPGEDVENGEARNQNISSADIYAKDSIYVGYSYHHPLNVTCKILNKMCLFIHLFIQYKFIVFLLCARYSRAVDSRALTSSRVVDSTRQEYYQVVE